MASDNDPLTEKVIGLAIGVHRQLGPGLLESAYEECLCYELAQANFVFRRQVALPVVYKSVRLDCGYRLDVVILQFFRPLREVGYYVIAPNGLPKPILEKLTAVSKTIVESDEFKSFLNRMLSIAQYDPLP